MIFKLNLNPAAKSSFTLLLFPFFLLFLNFSASAQNLVSLADADVVLHDAMDDLQQDLANTTTGTDQRAEVEMKMSAVERMTQFMEQNQVNPPPGYSTQNLMLVGLSQNNADVLFKIHEYIQSQGNLDLTQVSFDDTESNALNAYLLSLLAQ